MLSAHDVGEGDDELVQLWHSTVEADSVAAKRQLQMITLARHRYASGRGASAWHSNTDARARHLEQVSGITFTGQAQLELYAATQLGL